MTALSSPIKTEADKTSIESIVPPFGNAVCQSGEEVGVGHPALAEAHAYLDKEGVQEFMAMLAASPARIPDLAGGVLDPFDPSVMRIPLINAEGRYALIDAEDYPLVRRYRWRLGSSGRYAVCPCPEREMRMHRQILIVCGESEVDHINNEGLDNRKSNLRRCSHAENMWNMRRSSRNTTGVKGVIAKGDRYMATVTARKEVARMMFDDLEAATTWVTAKRAELHGEFARYD
jgi:hypothetical protein